VPAHEVGLAILEPLKSLDEVAYLRFASVYKAFESADDFAAEIASIMSATADGELAEESVRPHDTKKH
jgi:transcriptional repressor NrdR